ncbi:hypothetical protein EV195_101138 [Tenacibaculum skagerrakense]|uniref:Uncharacterized protein n=1 Tax=Tenacibaculum skagerrakense TaxID=186571 RepID=A0A4R2P040_9FLAO|nr:hypothetical protein [Tenacibaculum skagerrakense]TCP27979.1 hypothetical protein EV195_101138 [Tenacibaculum skagerrakense]
MNIHTSLFKNVSKLVSVLLVVTSIVVPNKLYSQPEEDFKKAQFVINQLFKNKKPSSYILLSTENKEYLIVEKKENTYVEHFIIVDKNNKITKVVNNQENYDATVLNRAFNKSNYHQEYIDWKETYAPVRNAFSGGKPVYFYYRSNDGNVYGETSLTSIVHPNPIDVSVYGYLLNKLTENIN